MYLRSESSSFVGTSLSKRLRRKKSQGMSGGVVERRQERVASLRGTDDNENDSEHMGPWLETGCGAYLSMERSRRRSSRFLLMFSFRNSVLSLHQHARAEFSGRFSHGGAVAGLRAPDLRGEKVSLVPRFENKRRPFKPWTTHLSSSTSSSSSSPRRSCKMTSASCEHASFVRSCKCLTSSWVATTILVPGAASAAPTPPHCSDPSTSSQPFVRSLLNPLCVS